MVRGGEHEAEAELVDELPDGLGGEVDPDAERLQDVGRAADRPVAERLPCLASAQPAPAAMSAAVVETLNVGRPPPVPAVSTRSSRAVRTGVASARIVAARPATSASVSPFVRSAMRNPAICVSDDLPGHDAPQDLARLLLLQVAARGHGVDGRRQRGVRHQRAGPSRKFASSRAPSGVSTDSGWNWTPSAGSVAVADAHDHPAAGARHLEIVAQGVRVDDERVVAPHRQRRAEAGVDRPAVVLDRRGLAVDGLVAHDGGPVGLREGLVPQADAERRDAGLGEGADRLHGDPGLVRRAGPGRDDDAVPAAVEEILDARAVVAHDVQVGPELAQHLDEVVGEGVVVVDDEDAHLVGRWAAGG